MKRKTCIVCDVQFIALRATARFCSVACRMKAHRRWKTFKASQLGRDALRGVTFLNDLHRSVTGDGPLLQLGGGGGDPPRNAKGVHDE